MVSISKVFNTITKFKALKICKNCSKSTEPLFCETVWQNAYKDKTVVEKTSKHCVEHHGKLNTFNHLLVHGDPYFENSINKPISLLEQYSPHEIIVQTDCEFKELAPLKEKLTVFRCIGEKYDFSREYNSYIKAKNVKKGENVYMSEYAYATQDINYAKVYLPNESGILYEIEIPEGAKVSRIGFDRNDEIVFPRSSKFEVVSNKKVGDYQHIKLKFLPRTNLYPNNTKLNVDV